LGSDLGGTPQRVGVDADIAAYDGFDDHGWSLFISMMFHKLGMI
jgi:hypothetical protein